MKLASFLSLFAIVLYSTLALLVESDDAKLCFVFLTIYSIFCWVISAQLLLNYKEPVNDYQE